MTITALGQTPDDGEFLARSGAKPDDVLAVCGPLGHAAAGLALLEHGQGQTPGRLDVDPELFRQSELFGQCVRAQTRPQPPLTAGAAALAAGASAGMDLSDGLLRDATRLAQASGVSIRLDDSALAADAEHLAPVAEALGAAPAEAIEWVLTGGEDYSLLATFPAGSALPAGFRAVGTVVTGEPHHGAGAVLTDHTVSGAGWDSVTR